MYPVRCVTYVPGPYKAFVVFVIFVDFVLAAVARLITRALAPAVRAAHA
jgi:hypothetical protein